MTIIAPDSKALFQHTNGVASIVVSASASGVPSGGGVEFILDAGTPNARYSTDRSSPYSCVLESVPLGEHTLDAYVVDSAGCRLPAHDVRTQVGVGELVIAMGDSITVGEVDDIESDNWSADGRNGPIWDAGAGKWYGGFEPILNNLLTQARGYPHSVVNEGVSGEGTDTDADGSPGGAIVRVNDLIARYPTARTWLVAYGTNDANRHKSATTFKQNLQDIITRIQTAIPGATVYLPKILYFNPSDSDVSYIAPYHDCMGDLSRSIPNVYLGADLETLFKGNHQQYGHSPPNSWFASTTTHHPNGLGFQKMAMLWKLALVDRAILVTDGVVGSFGRTWADKIHIDGANAIGLTQNNLLAICEKPRDVPAPSGSSFLGDWSVRLVLTGASGFSGGSITCKVRVEDYLLPADSTWGDVALARDSILLPTTWQDNANPKHPIDSQDLTATVDQPGQLSPVVATSHPPPVTTLTINPPVPDGANSWYISEPRISLSGTDYAGNPVAAIYYRWDSGVTSVYTGPFSPPQGSHTLYYHSVDQAGRSEPEKSKVVKVDTTPPTTPVVSDAGRYCEQGAEISFSWTPSSDPESGLDKYKYCIGTMPGSGDIVGWTSLDRSLTTLKWTASGAPGTWYYLSIKALNRAGVFSSESCSDGVSVPLDVASIGLAKRLPFGTPMRIRNAVVSANLGNVIYVQERDRSAGICVSSEPLVTPDKEITLTGVLLPLGISKALLQAETKDEVACAPAKPLGLLARSAWGSVSGGLGCEGLLVRVWGVVGWAQGNLLRISDDAGRSVLLVDMTHAMTPVTLGDWISVVGIMDLVDITGSWSPIVIPRSSNDVVVQWRASQ